ncbi:hypothetical protein [Streptomyces albireticuli]|uniref:hypothetical protein n=2 Tax=Streptomyces albireticuli TaxID=1940 RepID=UPI001E54F3C5|nr:hypothetical protein [Streptomyces albireticuli]MCD9144388.1 hypothetical protein [Streptomyces albireticuli]MCD9163549.1 hypothetical protein [Streptomyces albireticuli]MCD9193065.1 hypothetical protein [Streptomyces albireticuli]
MAPPPGGVHAQPTVFAQPAVSPQGPPPPPPAPGPPGARPPAPPQPYGQAWQGQQPPPPQQPHFPQQPQMPQPPQPSGRGNRTLLAVVGGVVALAVIGGGAFFLLKGGDGKGDPAPSKESAAAQGQDKGQGDKPAPDAGGSAPPTGDQPMVTGWQTQTSREYKFRYDVPAKGEQWKLFPQDTMIAYTDEAGKPQITMRDTASFREGGCTSGANPNAIGEAGKGQLANVGTMGGDTSLSIQENARNWAGNWGFYAYGGKGNKPKIDVTPAKPWKVNGIDGWTATAKVTVANRPSQCVPATAIVKSIVEKLPDGSFHSWVIYADQGVPNALSEAQIDKIMGTVRPVKG